jgi:acyl-CoA thioester hydrolase
MLKHQTEIRTRYADTDQMSYIYNGKYFEFFEVGRAEMMRENNLTYKDIETYGYHMPVIECHIKYVSPAFYDEILIIESRVEKMPSSRVHIDHKITSKERKVVVAEGYIELAFLKKETKKLSRPPEFFINAMKKYFAE